MRAALEWPDHMRDLWAVGDRLLAHVVIDNVIAASHVHQDEIIG